MHRRLFCGRSTERYTTRIEKKEKEYKKIIRACLKLDPKADIIDIKIATGFPIERVEKYYDEIYQEVVKKK